MLFEGKKFEKGGREKEETVNEKQGKTADKGKIEVTKGVKMLKGKSKVKTDA